MSGYDEFMAGDARLVILKELGTQEGGLNEVVLMKVLDVFGHHRPRDWVRLQLEWLASKGAIEVNRAGTVLVARITPIGEAHLDRRTYIDGVNKPSRQP